MHRFALDVRHIYDAQECRSALPLASPDSGPCSLHAYKLHAVLAAGWTLHARLRSHGTSLHCSHVGVLRRLVVVQLGPTAYRSDATL